MKWLTNFLFPDRKLPGLFPGKSESFIWHFLLFLMPVSIVLIIGISLHYFLHIQANQQTIEKDDILNVRLAKITVDNVLEDIVSDIKYLQEHNQIRNGFINTPRARKILEEDFLSFSKNRKIYDQIRYLNLEGKEIVRVNYNNGLPIVVEKTLLQQKDNRYYVAKTLELKKNSIYWSPFDLNMENQKIESPYKPTIRIGISVHNSYGHKTGVLILNFDGKKLIREFNRATANIANHIMLINENGYWLIHPQGKFEWGFMFSLPQSFAKHYPQLWEHIKKDPYLGQAYINNSLLTYSTVTYNTKGNPLSDNENALDIKPKWWKIIAFAPAKLLNQSHSEFIKRNSLFYIILFMVLVFGAFLLARLQINKQKAEAQSEYERSFRNILESMELIAITLDTEAKIIFCNQSFINLSGYSSKELCNSHWFECYVEEHERKKRLKLFFDSIKSGNSGGQGEGEIIIKDGSKRLIGWSSTLSYNSQNMPVSITFIGTDITEQRHTENELRKASQAVEQSPSTVMITDTSGKIVYSNPRFTELTGYTKQEVIGKTPKILSSGETHKDDYNNLWQAIKDGREWVGEFHNKKKNGELYWEAARISAIKDAQGKITNFLAVKEDITEKKQLAAEVELRNKEIAKNEILAGIGKMASMIAHDLRNPLSSIKMGMQILQNQSNKTDGVEEQELIHIGLEQVHYMESILSDLLSFSRPDQLNAEWLAVDKLLDTSLISVQKQIDENKVNISIHYQTGLPTIFVDKTKMRQIFSNLVTNALQAMTKEQHKPSKLTISVTLKLTDDGPKLEIIIADNGLGIDKSTQKKLFEPFFTTRAQGTGLGLAIVKRFIEQHKGSIIIDSEINLGTSAIINLPISPTITPETI
ncbi:MAG: PAS domain S-box protein [Pseudomonadota bacterium]